MTGYLLDTNIISNLVKPLPSSSLLAWMAARRDDELFISSLTIAEIRRGILDKPTGRKRDALEAWFAGSEGPPALFAGCILPFDDRSGLIWARLMTDGKRSGRPRNGLDMIVASIADANGCVLITDNEKDFEGFPLINPLREPD